MKRGKGTRPSTEYHPKSPAFRGIWVRPWGKRRDESKATSRFHHLPSPAITCLNANSDIEARCHLGFCVQPGSAGSGRPKEGNSIKRREAVSKGQPSHHSEPGVLTAKWVCCKSTHKFWSKSNFLHRLLALLEIKFKLQARSSFCRARRSKILLHFNTARQLLRGHHVDNFCTLEVATSWNTSHVHHVQDLPEKVVFVSFAQNGRISVRSNFQAMTPNITNIYYKYRIISPTEHWWSKLEGTGFKHHS